MIKNMGNPDRGLRAIAGIALLLWAVLGSGDLHWIGYFGVVPLATALVGFCPIYRMLRISSCKDVRQ